jgi:iron(III) transport system ATP-binding protein
MARVLLEGLSKRYGETWVVQDVQLCVEDGELVSLLGPSGCGKTTTLRMVAGFVRPDRGRIVVGERVVSTPEWHVPPERRGMAMVFQSYAVWPHMTVFQNVAYPLRCARVGQAELMARTRRALELARLSALAERYPHELSGGQQQRVALARALVAEPQVLLLDEPLSNLDARLREEMREEIAELQRRLGVTVLYVTHDQAEAMALSRRVAVMRDGRVEQVGTAEEVYENPATPFVARFVGAASFLDGEAVHAEDGVVRVVLGGGEAVSFSSVQRMRGPVTVCLRPEWLVPDSSGMLRGRVIRRTYAGDRVDHMVEMPGGRLLWRTEPSRSVAVGVEVAFRPVRAVLYPRTTATTSEGVSAT